MDVFYSPAEEEIEKQTDTGQKKQGNYPRESSNWIAVFRQHNSNASCNQYQIADCRSNQNPHAQTNAHDPFPLFLE